MTKRFTVILEIETGRDLLKAEAETLMASAVDYLKDTSHTVLRTAGFEGASVEDIRQTLYPAASEGSARLIVGRDRPVCPSCGKSDCEFQHRSCADTAERYACCGCGARFDVCMTGTYSDEELLV